MLLFKYVRKVLNRHFKQMNWQAMMLLVLLYIAVSWSMLTAAGEQGLTGSDFLYWLLVTASTVGYGDLSPTTAEGKLIVAFFVIPFGLSLFALTAGKVAAFSAHQWRKGIMGLKQLTLSDHIVVIGWDEQRTPDMLRLLLLEAAQNQGRKICLCVTSTMENPLPGEVEFVRAKAFNDDQDMARACLADASTIIIDTAQDDFTLTAGLYAYGQNPDAHVIAFFRDDSLARLLKEHCPTIECTPSVSTELMVKAAMDPGSSCLHRELLSVAEGMTQFSIQYPANMPELSVRDFYIPLKEHYSATLIAIDLDSDGRPEINPSLDQRVKAGCTLYYIADNRIKSFDWAELSAQ